MAYGIVDDSVESNVNYRGTDEGRGFRATVRS